MEKKDHEFCLRCGRKLKNPVAREKGYGTVCEKKIKIDMSRKLFKVDNSGNMMESVHLQSS